MSFCRVCLCSFSLSLSLSLFLSQLLLAGYSQFVELNTKVKALSGISITLPPKKVFGNKSKEFVAKRREGLQAYLLQLLHHPILQHSLVLKEFVDFRRYCSASLTTLPPPPSHHPLLTTHFSPPTSHHPLPFFAENSRTLMVVLCPPPSIPIWEGRSNPIIVHSLGGCTLLLSNLC